MNARYQIAVASLGEGLNPERDRMVRTVVGMGHFPIDFLTSGVVDSNQTATPSRHMSRTDYLVLIVSPEGKVAEEVVQDATRLFDLSIDHGVPVLTIVDGTIPEEPADDRGRLLKRLQSHPLGMTELLENVGDSPAWLLLRVIDLFPRPGWVPSSALPKEGVAAELARLSQENAELREARGILDPEGEAKASADHAALTSALQENKILIPLWDKTSSRWDQPFEMTLHQFFIRLAPEMAVEMASAEAAEFIPTGVCELDPEEARAQWIVPVTSLNLWLADLMALGLVIPSTRRHHAKDGNQYWALTPLGQEYFSRVRRPALERGGHRHLGFTSEFPIPGGPGDMH